jgi:hypothetical protein
MWTLYGNLTGRCLLDCRPKLSCATAKTGEMCGKFELVKYWETREDVCQSVAYIITGKNTVLMKRSPLVMVQIQLSPEFIHYSVGINVSFRIGRFFIMAQGLAKSVRLFRWVRVGRKWQPIRWIQQEAPPVISFWSLSIRFWVVRTEQRALYMRSVGSANQQKTRLSSFPTRCQRILRFRILYFPTINASRSPTIWVSFAYYEKSNSSEIRPSTPLCVARCIYLPSW